ncbi:MAG: hypothetical protein CMP59_08695 [Flavobacteriales bacterium]|nr:hypothetical protein [Flavobacteriales bacterium]
MEINRIRKSGLILLVVLIGCKISNRKSIREKLKYQDCYSRDEALKLAEYEIKNMHGSYKKFSPYTIIDDSLEWIIFSGDSTNQRLIKGGVFFKMEKKTCKIIINELKK